MWEACCSTAVKGREKLMVSKRNLTDNLASIIKISNFFFFFFLQVSFEADLANEPGYVSVRNIHIDKEYCHPFPLIGTEGTKAIT